jgi:hypothetical protein
MPAKQIGIWDGVRPLMIFGGLTMLSGFISQPDVCLDPTLGLPWE